MAKKRYYVDPEKMSHEQTSLSKLLLLTRRIPWANVLVGVIVLGFMVGGITGLCVACQQSEDTGYMFVKYDTCGNLVDCVIVPKSKANTTDCSKDFEVTSYYEEDGRRPPLGADWETVIIEEGGCNTTEDAIEAAGLSRDDCRILWAEDK